MIAFSHIQQFQPRALMNFSRLSLEMKIQIFTNLIQSDIAYLLLHERVKALPTFYPTDFVILKQHAAKQDSSRDKSTPFGTQQENAIPTTW